jgi:hypothetical protein
VKQENELAPTLASNELLDYHYQVMAALFQHFCRKTFVAGVHHSGLEEQCPRDIFHLANL